MKVDRVVRVLIALFIFLVVLAAIAASLFVTESALNVWARLGEGPAWVRYAFVGAIVTALLGGLWAVVRFVVPRRKPTEPKPEPMTRDTLEGRIESAAKAGADVSSVRRELGELDRRRADNTVQICVFGEVSAGKSTLIEALLPGADVATSPVGGSTVTITHYRWRADDGSDVLLTDVPGTGSARERLDDIARDEALRSHVVLYVCEGDLNRQQSASLRDLIALEKPTVVVMNKTDRYDDRQLNMVRERLRDRVGGLGERGVDTAVVSVSAGGREEVIRTEADGTEKRVVRDRKPQLEDLKLAIREMLARDPDALTLLRDQAVFRLAAEKLDAAQRDYRRQRADAIIRGYTKKAVVGALAAISPGSDIVIQGYLGTAMTRALAALWGVSVRDMDVEEFLNLSQSRVGKALPLTLAIAGNGLKAFPGIGTVAGGLVHAVAYGLIFDALGRSLADSLAERGDLEPQSAAREFEDSLSEHLEKGVRRVAQIALTDRNARED